MLNYETLLSSYDDKLTLMQWLKKVEAALKDASAVSFNVNKRGDATLTFSVVFEDGSELESNEIVLQQGESVASAYIQNGNLHLVLTNGDDLDAGNMFDGDVNIAGNLTAVAIQATGTGVKASVIQQNDNSGIDFFATKVTFNNDVEAEGDIKANTLEQESYNWESANYSMQSAFLNGCTAENSYIKFVQVNKCFHVIVATTIVNSTANDITLPISRMILSGWIPNSIASKLMRKDGTSTTQTFSSSPQISAMTLLVMPYSQNPTSQTQVKAYFGSGPNQCYIDTLEPIVIPANSKRTIDGRLTLLL